jgi:hypothetical protein
MARPKAERYRLRPDNSCQQWTYEIGVLADDQVRVPGAGNLRVGQGELDADLSEQRNRRAHAMYLSGQLRMGFEGWPNELRYARSGWQQAETFGSHDVSHADGGHDCDRMTAIAQRSADRHKGEKVSDAGAARQQNATNRGVHVQTPDSIEW